MNSTFELENRSRIGNLCMGKQDKFKIASEIIGNGNLNINQVKKISKTIKTKKCSFPVAIQDASLFTSIILLNDYEVSDILNNDEIILLSRILHIEDVDRYEVFLDFFNKELLSESLSDDVTIQKSYEKIWYFTNTICGSDFFDEYNSVENKDLLRSQVIASVKQSKGDNVDYTRLLDDIEMKAAASNDCCL